MARRNDRYDERFNQFLLKRQITSEPEASRPGDPDYGDYLLREARAALRKAKPLPGKPTRGGLRVIDGGLCA